MATYGDVQCCASWSCICIREAARLSILPPRTILTRDFCCAERKHGSFCLAYTSCHDAGKYWFSRVQQSAAARRDHPPNTAPPRPARCLCTRHERQRQPSQDNPICSWKAPYSRGTTSMDALTPVSPAKRRAALAPLDANAMPVSSPKTGVKDAVVKSPMSPPKEAGAGTKRRAEGEADGDASPAAKKTCLERDEVRSPCPDTSLYGCAGLTALYIGCAAAAALALAQPRLGLPVRHLGRRRRRLVGDGRDGARRDGGGGGAPDKGGHDAGAGERGTFMPSTTTHRRLPSFATAED